MSKSPEQTTLHDPYPPTDGASSSPLPSPSPLRLGTGTNGTAAQRTLPSHTARRRRPYWIVGLLALVVGIGGAIWYFNRGTAERADVITHKVRREILQVAVTEKGTLESADNRDLVCKVRAGNKGFATSINWVIDDGTRVKPGQLLMILDDSDLKDKEDTQSISTKQAMAAKVKADKDYEIQLKKNESAIALAKTTFTLAEIELDKLTGLAPDPALRGLGAVAGMMTTLTENGAFQQELDDISGQISLAQSTVEQNRERHEWAARMVKLSYMSAAQAQAEKSRLDSSIEDLRSKSAKRDLLMSHDRRQRITDLTSKRDNARRDMDKAILEAEALEVQFRTEMETKNDIYAREREKLEDIKQQRKECKIMAPDDIQDGSMVVYFKNEGSGRFGSNPQGLIEQGAQVKEGQKMLRIPNLDRMQVNTKVHEAMVARIRGDVRVPTRIVEFMQVGMLTSVNPINRALATRPYVIEEIRNEFRRHEYKKVADGQRATVRVDSLPEKQFVGHVRTVSAVASQTDSWISDVKLYQTYVLLDGELLPDGRVVPLEGERIKPDMTAEVTINIEASKEPVITVPIQAIVGGAEMGGPREVFVKNASGGFDRRPVTLGLYNDRMVEVRTGLQEGEEVVVNPKVLLGEKDKTKTREAGDSKGEKNGEKHGDKNGTEPAGPGGPGGPGGGPGGPGGFDPGKGGGFPGGGKGFPGGGKKGGKGGFPGGGGGGPPPIG